MLKYGKLKTFRCCLLKYDKLKTFSCCLAHCKVLQAFLDASHRKKLENHSLRLLKIALVCVTSCQRMLTQRPVFYVTECWFSVRCFVLQNVASAFVTLCWFRVRCLTLQYVGSVFVTSYCRMLAQFRCYILHNLQKLEQRGHSFATHSAFCKKKIILCPHFYPIFAFRNASGFTFNFFFVYQ